MSHNTVITSVRLPKDLKYQLDLISNQLNRAQSWVIIEALKQFLIQAGHQNLIEEARRQSTLASQHPTTDEELWEQNHDDQGWQS